MVLENVHPGVTEKLGDGWGDLDPRFPRLIHGAVSGFGHSGPEAEKPACDMVVQARGGVMSITGDKGRGPVRVGASIGDIVAGMDLMQGVLIAIPARPATPIFTAPATRPGCQSCPKARPVRPRRSSMAIARRFWPGLTPAPKPARDAATAAQSGADGIATARPCLRKA